MSHFTLDLDIDSPFDARIQRAIAIIREDKLDTIRCSLTGVIVGIMDNEAISDAIRVMLAEDFNLSADQLADRFAMQHCVSSSRPAPAFRVYKDIKHLLRILRNSTNGHSKMLAFLSGRFLFDTIVEERRVDTYSNLAAKLQFFHLFWEKIDSLPGWQNSLKAEDEDVAAESLQHFVEKISASNQNESKAAQRCFEALSRLDAIHNLRTNFYSQSLRAELESFRASDEISFIRFNELLVKVESDSIIRMSRQRSTPEGNALTLSLALEALSSESTRYARLAAKYEAAIQQKRPVVSNVDHIFKQLEMLTHGSVVTVAEEKKINNLLGRLNTDLVTDEHKAETLHRVMNKATGTDSPVQVRRGITAIRTARNHGIKLAPELEAKFQQAAQHDRLIRAKKTGKPVNTKPVGPAKSRAKTAKGLATAALVARLDKIFGDDLDAPPVVAKKKEG